MTSQLLWLLLPAMLANMAPVFFARFHLLESLNHPLDGGRTWRGQRLLGDHKTIRGFLVGSIAGALTAIIQYGLSPLLPFNSNTPLDHFMTALLFGGFLGVTALIGDSIKSFFKRRLNIRPGHSWPLFDQIDFVIPSLLVLAAFVPVSLLQALTVIIIIGVASAATSVFGVLLRIKSSV